MLNTNLIANAILYGGFTFWILVLCSIITSAVIIQKIIHFRRISRTKRDSFMNKIKLEIKNGDYDLALMHCGEENAPFAGIVGNGINLRNESIEKVRSANERCINDTAQKLEKNIVIVGTIGSVAVYIGLFGTVLGIINAFTGLSSVNTSGINHVIGGIADALVATAAGIFVAVPSVIAYNFMLKKIEDFIHDMEQASAEIIEILFYK